MGNSRVTGVSGVERVVRALRRSGELYTKSWALHLGEDGARCKDVVAPKLS